MWYLLIAPRLFASGLLGCTLSAFGPGGGPVDPQGPSGGTTVRFRLSGLEILADADTDGDGVVDNHLPDALAAIDLVLPNQGFAVDPFNERLADTIDHVTPVFLDAEWLGAALQLTVRTGSVDAGGAVRVADGDGGSLGGSIDGQGNFAAGEGDLEIETVFREGSPPVPLQLLQTNVEGSLDTSGIAGTLRTLLSVDDVIDDVIEPSIPEEGWDIDFDGIPDPKSEVMELVEQLAPLAADAALDDGTPAITAALAFDGYGG